MTHESADQSLPLAEELQPHLLLDAAAGQFATWRLTENNAEAIALFRDEAAAKAYRQSLSPAGWEPIQPDRRQLAVIVKSALDSGVQFAVLNPTENSASRVFQLEPMLAEVRAALDSDA